ncbi:MAG TPA: DNA polymerase III subunit gamma/tau [Steroidobacteraceae bacterium]|nr:DNA polymerase III subunit gamma/tau [Steroidobacteraceae bacterium]
MSYLVLARKWRPRSFDQLVGQDHVRRALTNALDSGRIHHAFLFTGTRGVGKTTIARIFAKSLNCETGISSTPCGKCATCVDIDAGRFVDLLEVDAASRTKVDDTRELLDNVQYAPARGRYKVYLIDEVHMLSTHSFNALLKTLEEPPPHVKFLLATTDPQKLPVTVLSRCLQFHLRRLPLPLIYDRLAMISEAEQVEFEPAALRAVARGAEGSMRDALSLLDQVLAFGGGKALEAEVRALLGTLDRKHVQGIVTALADKDGAALMRQAAHLDERAPDYHQALGELSGAIQRMALLQALPDLPPGEDEDEDAVLRELATKFAPEDLQLLYQIAVMARRDLDFAPDARAGFEMALLRMLAFRPQTSPPPSGAGGGSGGARAAALAAAGAGGGTRTAPSPVRSSAASGGGPASPAVARAGATAGAVSVRSAPPPWEDDASPASARAATAPSTLTASPDPAPVRAAPASAATEAPVDGWSALVTQLGLQGPTRQFAAHCVLLERKPGLVRLQLDSAGEAFRRPQIEQRIAQLLGEHFGEPTRLEIVLAERDDGLMTPAKREAMASEDRQRAAELSIDSDPAVRAMREVFGATIRPGSVKPLS